MISNQQKVLDQIPCLISPLFPDCEWFIAFQASEELRCEKAEIENCKDNKSGTWLAP